MRIEAPKAMKGYSVERGIPLHTGGKRELCPSPENFFRFLSSKRGVLVHFGCYFCS